MPSLFRHILGEKLRVVVIGGGSGSFAVLSALRDIKGLFITAIVTTMDSGGVAWWERENDMLPTSDMRKCLLALSTIKTTADLYRVIGHRFDGVKFGAPGDVSLGNLLIAGVIEELGFEHGLKFLCQILNLHDSIVVPVSQSSGTLHVKLQDGTVIQDEHRLDNVNWDGTIPITDSWIEPTPKATNLALKAIIEADVIIFPPGDVYGSIMPNLLVSGVVEAIRESNARVVDVINLMTKYGQTHGWGVSDHVALLERTLGLKIDTIIVNSGHIHPALLAAYEGEHAAPVANDLEGDPRLFLENFVPGLDKPGNGGRIVRHDVQTLRRVLQRVL